MVLLKCFGLAEDVATAMLFLAPDDGSFVTDIDLLVEGRIGSL